MSTPTLSRRMIYGRWNEQTRVYDIPGMPGLPSVTSVIGMKAKPALINWAAKLSAEYSQEHRQALNELDPEAAVDAIKGSWRRSRDKAADFGTAVHDAIETGKEPDIQMAPYVRSSERALQDLGVDVIGQEITLVSVQHVYAGSADVQGSHLARPRMRLSSPLRRSAGRRPRRAPRRWRRAGNDGRSRAAD